ncbi:MAG: hypothetical protein AAGK17_01630 [Pseudomonadota bacterium]
MQSILSRTPVKLAAIGVVVLSAAIAAPIASAAISSNVYIDAKETFVLGGQQPGAFTVKGQNKGNVTVEVFASDQDETVLVAKLEPGERFKADFAQGEAAWLRNTSQAAKAHVKVRVTGTTSNLGMGYQGWDDAIGEGEES